MRLVCSIPIVRQMIPRIIVPTVLYFTLHRVKFRVWCSGRSSKWGGLILLPRNWGCNVLFLYIDSETVINSSGVSEGLISFRHVRFCWIRGLEGLCLGGFRKVGRMAGFDGRRW